MKQTGAEIAYSQIRKKIVTLELQPGSVIQESSLMDELGLGRTPIRESLKQLQAENLVFTKARRGTFVSQIAITDLTQIHEVRIEIEAACARLAASRIQPNQLAALKALIQKELTASETNRKYRITLDRQFHSILARAAHNKFLYDDWEKYYDFSQRIWHLALQYVQPGDLALGDHPAILAAVKAQKPEGADQLMRNHITRFQEIIKQYL